MTVVTRFAPSPTGRIHIGNARTAFFNWLFAKKKLGSFVLRFDDTDRERSKPEYERAIDEDLRWLGLAPDGVLRQSDRLALYEAAAETLRAAGRLYPAFETPEELERKRRRQLARGLPPVYDRAALKLSDEEKRRLESEGRRPHWRFRLEGRDVAWDDLVRGPQHFDAASLSDPVLVREDGTVLYTLTSVVDDGDLGISHVIRGEDHVANTAVQIELFEALGAAPPAFAHLALIADAGGEMLSKRLGSLSLAGLREEGIEPMAVNSVLAKLGTSDAVEPRLGLDELVSEFDLAKFGRAQPRLDLAELRAVNAKLLHLTPFEAVANRLPEGATREFWEAVRPNLERVADAALWWRVCEGPVTPVIEEPDYLAAAAAALPAAPFDRETWSRWTQRLKDSTGRKGKALFLPLRLALTGLDHGPELQALLPLIGRDRALRRLRGETA
jgi:glutamyl-tRNA synthetase